MIGVAMRMSVGTGMAVRVIGVCVIGGSVMVAVAVMPARQKVQSAVPQQRNCRERGQQCRLEAPTKHGLSSKGRHLTRAVRLSSVRRVAVNTLEFFCDVQFDCRCISGRCGDEGGDAGVDVPICIY